MTVSMRPPDGTAQRRAPAVFCLGVGALVLCLLPWESVAVGPHEGFLPAVLAVVACLDLLSVVLLLSQFRAEGDPRLLAMAVAYCWSLGTMLGYAGAFPGVVAVTPPLATAPSVAPWLYLLWHTGFPVLLGLAWAPWPGTWARTLPLPQRRARAWLSVGAASGGAAGLVAVLVAHGPDLPVLIRGVDTSRMTALTAPVCLPLVVVAGLVTTRALRGRSGPERWTAAAVWVCLLDLLLTYASRHRYSLGWYAGRGLTLIAAAVVLLALLREATRVKAHLHDALTRAQRVELLQRTILDNLSETVVLTDTDSRVLMLNGAARRVLPHLRTGERAAPVPMRDASGQLVPDADRPTARTARTGEPVRDVVVQITTEAAGELWLSINTTPVPGGPDQPAGVLSSLSDVTSREHARVELERAAGELERALATAVAADRAKTTFLATMSHEIRTPMNAVIGLTDLLRDTDLDAQQRELVDSVHGSGEALLGVINDILDFTKIEAGELDLEDAPFALRDCLETALQLVAVTAGSKGLEVVLDLPGDCPGAVVGDATRFRQVVVNLLSNALKFTAEGEVVVAVGARAVPGDPARVAVEVSVTDTGIGIPAQRHDRLFRSFSQVDSSITRTYGGTGLGLVISRRLARAMGGDLTVTSTVGVGSTFLFTSVLGADPAGQTPVERDLVGCDVLLVEHSASQRRALERLLTGWGASCTAVGTSGEGLAVLGSGSRTDLALVSARLPDGDGVTFSGAATALPGLADLPCVLMTSPQEAPAGHVRERLAGTLTRPVRAGALHERLQAALGRHVPAPAVAPEGATAVPLRVLVAEDNPVNQLVATLMLERLGHRCAIAANGLEAVQAVLDGDYDAVLMDLQMPLLDGLSATQRIRAELPRERQPVIVAVTASVLVEDLAASREAGMDDHVGKPIRAGELAACLARVHRRPAVARG